MTVFRHVPVSKWLLAAVLVSVAQALFAPANAAASCGDYVMLGGHSAGHGGLSTPAVDAGFQTVAGHESGDSNEHRGHCTGPFCSNGSIPPAAPAPQLKVAIERWAVVREFDMSEVSPVCLLTIRGDSTPGSADGRCIFRPPR
ncbi:MAG TPA: hypothetical protein VGH74_19550 [Planctomycetaceae bacterium]|jgi:hypothetical protein